MPRTICEMCGKLFMKVGFGDADVCPECNSNAGQDELRYMND